MKIFCVCLMLLLASCSGMYSRVQSITYSLIPLESGNKTNYNEFDNFLPIIEFDDVYLWITPAEARSISSNTVCEFYRSGLTIRAWNRQAIILNLKQSIVSEINEDHPGPLFWIKNYKGNANISSNGESLLLPPVDSIVLAAVKVLFLNKREPDGRLVANSNEFLIKFGPQDICSDKPFYILLNYTNGAGEKKEQKIYFSPLVFTKLNK